MGSLMSHISDDYDDYVYLCGRLGIEAMEHYRLGMATFYNHRNKILEEYLCTSVSELLQELKKEQKKYNIEKFL